MEKTTAPTAANAYTLDQQVGFVLRRATQRHLAIFGRALPDLTPTQFAALAKLHEVGPLSQNALGRLIAMDAATIKGVVDRLVTKGLLTTTRDDKDRRRSIIALSVAGQQAYGQMEGIAADITAETLAPLDPAEQAQLLALLERLT